MFSAGLRPPKRSASKRRRGETCRARRARALFVGRHRPDALTQDSANCTAASMSSTSRSGKSSRISSLVIPPRSMETTVSTGMRNPRMHGTPPICSDRMVMREKAGTMAEANCSALTLFGSDAREINKKPGTAGNHRSLDLAFDADTAIAVPVERSFVHPRAQVEAGARESDPFWRHPTLHRRSEEIVVGRDITSSGGAHSVHSAVSTRADASSPSASGSSSARRTSIAPGSQTSSGVSAPVSPSRTEGERVAKSDAAASPTRHPTWSPNA